jgi:putative tricarboxylic transport membrane protein
MMKRTVLYCNLFWLLLSLVTCIESYRARLGTINKPGSGFFPFCAGLIMLVLILVSLFQSMGVKDQGGEGDPKDAGEAGGERSRWWNIPIILAAIVAYALTLEKSGFLINTFFFVFLMLKVVQPQTWKTSIIAALISAVAANVIFNVVFRAQIPTGILGF